MRLLCSSSDLRELTDLVKRLLRHRIPCGVCRDTVNCQLSVWVQQDSNFPQALKIFADRDRPRALPPWALLLGSPVPVAVDSAVPAGEGAAVAATDGKDMPNVVVVQSKGSTRTGTVEATGEGHGAQPRRGGQGGEGRHRRWLLQGF